MFTPPRFLYFLWPIIDRILSKRLGIKPLRKNKTGIINIELYRYKGTNPIQLDDASTINPGDKLIEIHLNGAWFRQQRYNLGSLSGNVTWRGSTAFSEDLTYLTGQLTEGRLPNDIKALHSKMLLSPLAQRLGFTILDIPDSLHKRFTAFYLTGLRQTYYSGNNLINALRKPPELKEIWMPKSRLLERYSRNPKVSATIQEGAANSESNPLISVVIPAINEEKLLGRCLSALKEQDYTGDYEIIVVDNASIDRTGEIALSHGVKVVFEENIGTGSARQCGLSEATGEIVAFTDADTIVPKYWLSTMANYFKRNSGIIAVTGPYAFFDTNILARIFSRIVNCIFIITDNTFRLVTRKGGTIWGSNFAGKRKALLEAGGFDTSIKFLGEDYELSTRLKTMGKMGLLPTLFVLTSARRIKEKGLVCTYWNYIANYFSVLFCNKPLSLNLEDKPRKIGRAILNRLHPLRANNSLISYGNRSSNKIALTFDDGPNEPFTSQILGILHEHEIKATFFLLGENVKHHANICQRIQEEGHMVGNHSYRHSRWLALRGTKAIAKELKLTQDIIYRACGVSPNLFRPPYGYWSPWMLRVANDLGYRVITWDNMTNDWEAEQEPDEIIKAILKNANGGGIIVVHDGRDTKSSYDRSSLLAALPIIITSLKRHGYQLVTVPELLNE